MNGILGTLSDGVSDFVGRRRPGGFGWGGWKDSGGAHWRLAYTKPLVFERRDLVDRGDGLETSALKAACTRMKRSRVRRSGRQIGAARRAGADGQSLENCEAWKFVVWSRGGRTRTEIAYRVSVGETVIREGRRYFCGGNSVHDPRTRNSVHRWRWAERARGEVWAIKARRGLEGVRKPCK